MRGIEKAVFFCLLLFVIQSFMRIYYYEDERLSFQSSQHKQTHFLLTTPPFSSQIINTNSSQYTWVGNSWRPPAGVPVFTPQEIKMYFERRNVLVIGDSTARRFYNTLYALISSTSKDFHDVKADEIDHSHIIDYGKKNKSNLCPQSNRYISRWYSSGRQAICRDINNVDIKNDANETIKKETAKFDLMAETCFNGIEWLWRDHDDPNNSTASMRSNYNWGRQRKLQMRMKKQYSNKDLYGIQKDYDLIILSMGIWDFLMADDVCRKNERSSGNMLTDFKSLFAKIERNNPHRDLQVVIRTSGFHMGSKGKDQVLYDLNDICKEFSYNKTIFKSFNNNITIVDWGSVMSMRSYGNERIRGDGIPSHYGLEARTLLIQQLMHELLKNELLFNN